MSFVMLIGKPNSGKSLLFNRLTGLKQKVANFPGITVEVSEGRDHMGNRIVDFPGVYSLNALTQDESHAVKKFYEALKGTPPQAIVCVLDATRLERSLVLGLQVQKVATGHQVPVIFALNMMDMLPKQQKEIDVEGLRRELGSPVVPLSARTRTGVSELESVIEHARKEPQSSLQNISDSEKDEASDLERARDLQKRFGPSTDILLKSQNQIDHYLLSGFWGSLLFVAIMLVLFQSIFTWAEPIMGLVESSMAWLGQLIQQGVPPGVFQDFLVEAMIGGVGSFLVFVPQIFVLTFIVGLMEDSGYMARAAIICHRPLSFFGLTGKSFVPLLSGVACAIPAALSARTIESKKRRWLTLLAIPLMPCAARLPVYSLLIAAMIPPTYFLGGLIGYRGLAFFAIYAFGIFLALLVTGLLSTTFYRNEKDSPFVLELPPYRWPHWKPLYLRSVSSTMTFLRKAGSIIFVVTVVVWLLAYFPNGSGNLESSWLARFGQWLEPLFTPLGLDWRFGVAILTSFLAREVFVGTLGTLFGMEAADENIAGLNENLLASGFSMGSALSLLLFYAIALQCASTLAILKQETGSWRFPIMAFTFYGGLAYGFAVLVQLFF